MKKRFVIGISQATAQQETAFVEHIKPNCAWWHWVTNLWLLVDANGVYTAATLRDLINAYFPGANTMVIELSPDGADLWAATVPAGNLSQAKEWLENTWTR
jgi:hypothetical protein